jgi:hypothetical protein
MHSAQQLSFTGAMPAPVLASIACAKHCTVIAGAYTVFLIEKIYSIKVVGYITVTLQYFWLGRTHFGFAN